MKILLSYGVHAKSVIPELTKLGDYFEKEEKLTSKGWGALQPMSNVVGPELSFARRVMQEINAPIAIIKCAAGGTTLGGDWNPDEPSGFRLYPLALQLVQSSLAELDRKKVP